jgi:hypothetical protein
MGPIRNPMLYPFELPAFVIGTSILTHSRIMISLGLWQNPA